MNIRQFGQLCKAIAGGQDATALWHGAGSEGAAMVQMARDQRVLPLLAVAIGQNRRQGGVVPSVQTPLQHVTKNLRIKGQLLEIDRCLQGSDCGAILIKGAVRLFDGVYPNIGMRHLADIDILVPDQKFGLALVKMGYRPADANCQDTYDATGRPVLPHGAHHLTPVIRLDDPVTIEPHLLATAARYRKLLPTDLTSTAVVVPGCKNLRQLSGKNDLIVNLIHTLLHDRDTLDGGLLLRGLVECELMFARLAAEDQAAVARHFADCGAAKLWTAWRALSDWLFGGDDKALWRSVSGYLLISEFRLRARGYRMVFVISVLHRIKALAQVRYWTSGTVVGHARRYGQLGFWARISDRFRRAYKG